jgi:AbrB family looped-hinge helix DNA binding protein
MMVGMKRKLGSKGQVVIPKEIRDQLSIAEGANLTFEVSGDTILVKPEPSPETIVERFLSVKGRKRRKLVDWRSAGVPEHRVAPSRSSRAAPCGRPLSISADASTRRDSRRSRAGRRGEGDPFRRSGVRSGFRTRSGLATALASETSSLHFSIGVARGSSIPSTSRRSS